MRYLQELTSLVLALCGLALVISGIVLYILPGGPQGATATFLLSKGQWKALHIDTALLFLIAVILHVYFNWSCLWCYIQPPLSARKTLRRWALPTALLIFIVVLAASLTELSPISSHKCQHHGRQPGQGFQYRGQ